MISHRKERTERKVNYGWMEIKEEESIIKKQEVSACCLYLRTQEELYGRNQTRVQTVTEPPRSTLYPPARDLPSLPVLHLHVAFSSAWRLSPCLLQGITFSLLPFSGFVFSDLPNRCYK